MPPRRYPKSGSMAIIATYITICPIGFGCTVLRNCFAVPGIEALIASFTSVILLPPFRTEE
jgi:hypothetical protein